MFPEMKAPDSETPDTHRHNLDNHDLVGIVHNDWSHAGGTMRTIQQVRHNSTRSMDF